MKLFYTHLTTLVKLALLCLFTLLIASHSFARDISFAWATSPNPLTGYKLYYKIGTVSGPPYDGTDLNVEGSPILLGNVTTTTVTGLSPNETYQFAITAYNETGESDLSPSILIEPLSFPSPTINIMSQN